MNYNDHLESCIGRKVLPIFLAAIIGYIATFGAIYHSIDDKRHLLNPIEDIVSLMDRYQKNLDDQLNHWNPASFFYVDSRK